MIRVLGKSRVIILVVLVTVNVLVAYGVYGYLMPDSAKKERELRMVRSQVSTLRTDISRLSVEFSQLETQRSEFEALKEKGFFSKQGRREAELLFEAIQKQAGVISAVANIRSGEFEESEESAKADHVVLRSPIEVRVEAMDELNIYKYIDLVERVFPGHVSVQNITMKREKEVTGALLRSISSGASPVLVSAKIDLMWRTMIPQADVIGAGGGRP